MSPPRSLRVLPLLVVALVVGCSDDGGTTPDLAALEGRTWYVHSITEDGVARPIVDGTDITLRFEPGRVQADAGCNGMSGDITFDGDELVLVELGRELMLCEPEALMDQEDWLAGLLLDRPSVAVVDGELTMTTDETTVELSRDAPGGGAVAAELDGRDLVATWIKEDGVERGPVAGTEIRLTFEDGQLGASAGCNSMGGRYALDGAVLVVDELSTTDMGCQPPLMAQDEWLADLLVNRPTVFLDGDVVVLDDGSSNVGLTDREVVRPDAPLVGTVWVLDTIFAGGPGGAASSIPGDVEASVTFADDGTFGISAGCNGIGGEYEQTGEATLVLAGTGSTLAGCPADVAAVEELMLDVFAPGEVEAVIDDQRLTITAGDAGLGFRAAP